MIRWRRGTVAARGRSWPGSVELDVVVAGESDGAVGGRTLRALAHPPLVGDPQVGDAVLLGGQDCHAQESGAHTGEVSAEMLADAGASHVIVGHSERRADHAESDAVVRAKAEAARRAGLTPIVCVGETREEREAGRAEAVVRGQLEGSLPDGGFVVAYEPVWAIGTGLTPTTDDIDAMHNAIRDAVGGGMPILYGGSMKPGNASEILAVPEVGGGLIGGASLKAADLLAIVDAAG